MPDEERSSRRPPGTGDPSPGADDRREGSAGETSPPRRRDAADDDRPELSTRDVWRLIWASYKVSFPYFVVVVLGLALTTWIVTTLLF